MDKIVMLLNEYSRNDLMMMDPVSLGALLRERTHHKIEVPLYRMLGKDKYESIENFGMEAELIYGVWKERGLPLDNDDIQWSKGYLDLAKKVKRGEKVELDMPIPVPFTPEEMAVVEKLIYKRHSIRDWEERDVPDAMIHKILEAGRAAPIGCNLCHVRFIVLKSSEEKKMIWSDVPTQNAAAIIVLCHDTRAAQVVGQNKTVPQNAGFDSAAAADHMLLMAHALGLGGVWLSSLKETAKTKNTGNQFKEKFGLPEYIEIDCHIAIGWPSCGTIKSARMPLEDMIIKK